MTELLMVRCPSCGTLNRVSPEKAGTTGKCGSCGARLQVPAGPASPVVVGDTNFQSSVMDSGIPVLVDFWAPGCGHCIRMEPALEQLARDLTGRAKVAKLDVSANPRTASFFEIRGTPSFVLVKDGKEAARFIGAMTKDELADKIRPYV